MQPLNTKFLLIDFLIFTTVEISAGILSSLSFLVISSLLAIFMDKAGQAAGWAIIGFLILTPVIGALGAIVAVILALLCLLLTNSKANLEKRWTAKQFFIVIFAGIFISLIIAASMSAVLNSFLSCHYIPGLKDFQFCN